MHTTAKPNRCQTVREVLVAAHDLIADPSRHCVKFHACNAAGNSVPPTSRGACQWCSDGALMRFADGELLDAADAALSDAARDLYGTRHVAPINDGPNGHARILAAYARAIDGLPSTQQESQS
jgi:hypothetical protein